MDRYKSTRPLCEIGRAPGTAPAATKEKGGRPDDRTRWEADVPVALANLALARVLGEQMLSGVVVLRVLQQSSTKAVLPFAKREWLRSRHFIFANGDGLWDVHELGHAEIARTSAKPSLKEKAVRKILEPIKP